MTPLETLAKYGLKTDVKSIRERVFLNVEKRFSYSEFLIKWLQNIHGVHVQIPIDSDFRHAWEEIKNADLALLCSLAEKGERYEKAVKERKDLIYWLLAEYDYSTTKHRKLCDFLRSELKIITEAEGETKCSPRSK